MVEKKSDCKAKNRFFTRVDTDEFDVDLVELRPDHNDKRHRRITKAANRNIIRASVNAWGAYTQRLAYISGYIWALKKNIKDEVIQGQLA